MFSGKIHSALTLALCWAQVALALAGPAGLLFCQDANGSSHYEWREHHDRSIDLDVHTGSVSSAASVNDEMGSSAETLSDFGSCDDEPVSVAESILSGSRSLIDMDIAVGPPVSLAVAGERLNQDSRSLLFVIGRVPCGPPLQVSAALRSTILII